MSSTYKSDVDNAKKAIKRAEKKALEGIGKLVMEEAKKRVPVATGKLRDSIQIDIKNNRVKVGIADNETFSQSDKFYARFQEFGTMHMKAANGDKGYLRPAAEENINEIVEITKTHMGEVGK